MKEKKYIMRFYNFKTTFQNELSLIVFVCSAFNEKKKFPFKHYKTKTS